jgi:hypothetical protein
MDGVLVTDHRIRLGTFLALNDVELDVIALFQSLVPIQLNGRVVDEYIGSVVASDESITLGVVKPLDLPFVLSHRLPAFFGLTGDTARTKRPTDTQFDERMRGKVGAFFRKVSQAGLMGRPYSQNIYGKNRYLQLPLIEIKIKDD